VQKEWIRREQEAYTNKILRGLETLDEIKEHAKEFNQKSVIKVSLQGRICILP
jgi:hypothetical protein